MEVVIGQRVSDEEQMLGDEQGLDEAETFLGNLFREQHTELLFTSAAVCELLQESRLAPQVQIPPEFNGPAITTYLLRRGPSKVVDEFTRIATQAAVFSSDERKRDSYSGLTGITEPTLRSSD